MLCRGSNIRVKVIGGTRTTLSGASYFVLKFASQIRCLIFAVFFVFCRQMYQMCGELEGSLGKEILQHELEIEENVLNPLSEVLDVSTHSD